MRSGRIRDLRGWQEAMTLAEECYEFSQGLPREERFGSTSRPRRAVASVPAISVEGYGRDSRGSYVSFSQVAQESLEELETHLILAKRMKLGSHDMSEVLLSHCETVGKTLRGLIRNVRNAGGPRC